jgi:hypothetical protein
METRLTNKTVAQDEGFSWMASPIHLILRCLAQRGLEGRNPLLPP